MRDRKVVSGKSDKAQLPFSGPMKTLQEMALGDDTSEACAWTIKTELNQSSEHRAAAKMWVRSQAKAPTWMHFVTHHGILRNAIQPASIKVSYDW